MTRSTNMEHVEVLERLRGVLEHGKMGDKCLIAPDLVTAAIASLSAPQPPAEAQGGGEAVQVLIDVAAGAQRHIYRGTCPDGIEGFGSRDPECPVCRAMDAAARTPPPSAPVGVVDVDALAQEIRRVDGKHSLGANALAEALVPYLARTALAQQPAADSPSFTAGDMADAAAQGFRDGVASVGAVGVDEGWRKKAADWLEARAVEQEANNQRWPDHAAAYETWRNRPSEFRELARRILAAQQGGRSDD